MPMPMAVEFSKRKPTKWALKIEIQEKNEIKKQLIGKFTNEDEILECLKSLNEIINTSKIPDIVTNTTEDLNDLNN